MTSVASSRAENGGATGGAPPARGVRPPRRTSRRVRSISAWSIQTGVAAATKRAMCRADWRARAVVVRTSTMSRGRMRRVIVTMTASESSINSNP